MANINCSLSINEEDSQIEIIGLEEGNLIIDISGDCGGYNLQWAWSSGYIAGRSTCGNL